MDRGRLIVSSSSSTTEHVHSTIEGIHLLFLGLLLLLGSRSSTTSSGSSRGGYYSTT